VEYDFVKGQWLGHLTGEVPGSVVLDLDERSERYTGTALFIPDEAGVPSTVAIVDTGSKAESVAFKAAVFPLRENDRRPMSQEELAAAFPNVAPDQQADLELKQTDAGLFASYKTTVSSAAGTLLRYEPGAMSTYAPSTSVTWSDFKSQIAGMDLDNFVWRGQCGPWSLQTSFHRTGRVDLNRYVQEDIRRLQGALLPHTKTFLEITSPLLTGGLYSLAQHYGYPTPILDWTYSPYVAAFFAFRTLPKGDASPPSARIFAFNRATWPQAIGQLANVALARPHVTVMDLPALENERALPQQAVAMVTNLENIESFIRFQEQQHSQQFLIPFDLRWTERSAALRDLRTMGITAGSMFPGIDGTCEQLRHQWFETEL
jgi:hypothetical protein